MGTEGTRVWKGYDYGRDTGMEGTSVWKGNGYGENMGLERDKGMEGI